MEELEQELKFFGENHAKWSEDHPGQFVLVKGRELVGFFDQPETALTTGARLFGADSFLVRRVDASDEDIYIPALALGLLHADPS
jgi:hypothetical protein